LDLPPAPRLGEDDSDIILLFPHDRACQQLAGAEFDFHPIAGGELAIDACRQAVGRHIADNADVADAAGMKQGYPQKRKLSHLPPAFRRRSGAGR
jgi:hypothetical protein